MAMIDVRFAGGPVTVATAEYLGSRVVSFDAPTGSFPMFPDEARALALRLIESAAAAERDVPDDWIDTDG